ncbi:V-type ATPase subunit, partial [Candidatus Peregrinibacteria bacterium]|nr:V-type ATPase subunit [Candidatus Peregrinibacteria bacterium]
MTTKYDFAYSVGLVRALETLLLTENEVERMMLAKSAKEAFKVLNEFDYADNKAGIEDASEFQKVLDEGLMDIKEFLVNATPDKRILNILWHQYDFHNIKTLLKAKLSGQSYEGVKILMNGMGAISISSLKNYIFDGQKDRWGIDECIE